MRLVGVEEVNYTETGDAVADLNCITDNNHSDCGANDLSTIPTLRDQTGADLVQFVTNTSNYCGLAWVGAGSFQSTYGYSTKLFSCGASTMAHELGHNMGLGHDRYETGYTSRASSPYGHGHGFVDLINKTRTIMSYNNLCSDYGFNCQTIGIFSNPNITKSGMNQGDPEFTDAASRINETYPLVANFRTSSDPANADISPSCVSNYNSEKDVHCFIASVAFGSYLHPQVKILRAFRDNFLLKSRWGTLFVKNYYKYSPYWAEKISAYPLLMSIIRALLSSAAFLILNPWIFALVAISIILFIFRNFFGRTPRRPNGKFFSGLFYRGLNLLILFPSLMCISSVEPVIAQIAQPSLFENEIVHNPAASYAPLRNNYLGLSHHIINSKNLKTSVLEIEEAGGLTALHGGIFWGQGALLIQNQIPSDITTKSKSTLETITDKSTTEDLQANLSLGTWDFLNLGLKYKQQSIELKRQGLLEPEKSETSVIGLGGLLTFFDSLQIGGSADYITRKGDSLPETKYLDLSLGLAWGQRRDSGSWLIELSAQRSPEVLNEDFGLVFSQGEIMTYNLSLEREFQLSDSIFDSMRIGGRYTDSTEMEFENFLEQDQKTISTNISLGGRAYSKSLDVILNYQNSEQKFGEQRKETRMGLSLLYKFRNS